MHAGYLYVLINPAMPGLAKVGMTSRDPTDRVSELSGATGIPSPFILVYQHPVSDCAAAERWVHTQLEAYRTASNREFFNAPLHHIVSVIARLPPSSGDSEAAKICDAPQSDAESLYELGLEHLSGSAQALKSPAKALKFFLSAADTGHGPSALQAGRLFQYGDDGIKADKERALAMYRRAWEQGELAALPGMALVFWDVGQFEDGAIHWNEFFRVTHEFVSNSKEPGLVAHVRRQVRLHGPDMWLWSGASGEVKAYERVDEILLVPFLDELTHGLEDSRRDFPRSTAPDEGLLFLRQVRRRLVG